ncbi:MAG TPA: hypothetical protein VFB82_23275 [Blastocatellia bacterium]|jgi:hypothetical protein|nr:hypothetical protein [Blastocatellia bacterium]
MSTDAFEQALNLARSEMESLKRKRDELEEEVIGINERIAKLTETEASLSRLCGEKPTLPRMELSFVGVGPALAVREVVKSSNVALTPMEVRDRIVAGGFDVAQHNNPMASIHTALKRLASTPEVSETLKDGKKAYRWNRIPRRAALSASTLDVDRGKL